MLAGMCGRVHAQSAQPIDPATGVELRYAAPEGCGSRELVLREVRRASGKTLGADVDLKVDAHIVAAEHGLKVRYDARRRGATSKRELLVADCPAAVEAVALLILLTLEPVNGNTSGESFDDAATSEQRNPADTEQSSRASRADVEVSPPNATRPNTTQANDPPANVASKAAPKAARRNSKPPNTPKAVAQPPTPFERAPDSERASERSRPADVSPSSDGLRFSPLRVVVNYELATGLGPAAANGVRLSLGTALGGVRGELSGASLWVPDTPVNSVVGSRLISHAYRGRVQLGYPIDVGGVWLAPAAGVGIEHLWARVDGISNPASNATTWLTGSLGLDVEVPLSRAFALRAGAAAFLMTQRPKFTVVNLDVVHQPEPWGAEGALGAVWTWPTRSGTP